MENKEDNMEKSCKLGLCEHKPYLENKDEHKEHTHHHCSHGHSEHSHEHSHAHVHDHRGGDKKVLKWALGITIVTMFLEFFYGFLSNSLALISDAIHMFTHSFALIISLVAIIIASKKAPKNKTFGYYRVEVIAAFVNGLTIVLSIVWIIYEAIERYLNPKIIDIKMALIVAIIGLVVNVITGYILMQGDKENINLKSSFVHMLADALSSVAIILGYIIIYYTSWYWLDMALALMVSVIIGKWALNVLKDSTNTLLEASPVDIDEVKAFIEKNENVYELHDMHIWEITGDMYVLSAHAKIKKDALDEYEDLLKNINKGLKEKYKIVHSTFQFEW